VYLSDDHDANARPATLRGEYITSLTAGATNDEMLAVIDKSEIVRLKTDAPEKTARVKVAPPKAESRPGSASLLWFVFDLHFGKGIFDPLSSMIMNDVGGVGMFVPSITGLLYRTLPKWRKSQARNKAAKDSKTAKATKKATTLWLLRIHSVTLGVASVLMLIYLSLTGVFLGHGRERFFWLQTARIPQLSSRRCSAWRAAKVGSTPWRPIPGSRMPVRSVAILACSPLSTAARAGRGRKTPKVGRSLRRAKRCRLVRMLEKQKGMCVWPVGVGEIAQLFVQLRICRSLRYVAHGLAVDGDDLAGPTLRQSHVGPKVRDSVAFCGGPYHFFPEAPAAPPPPAFDRRGASSGAHSRPPTPFRRLASDTSMPPYLALQL